MNAFANFARVVAAAVAVPAAGLLCDRVALAGPVACGLSPFPVGSDLPEPGPLQRVARIFSLRSADGSMRVGRLYQTATGATFYLSETDDVAPKAVAIEIGYLEAAGYSAGLARQYTHLAEIPAVPPVAHGLALAKRRGLIVSTCR